MFALTKIYIKEKFASHQNNYCIDCYAPPPTIITWSTLT